MGFSKKSLKGKVIFEVQGFCFRVFVVTIILFRGLLRAIGYIFAGFDGFGALQT